MSMSTTYSKSTCFLEKELAMSNTKSKSMPSPENMRIENKYKRKIEENHIGNKI